MTGLIGAVVHLGEDNVAIVLVTEQYLHSDGREDLRVGLSIRLGGMETVLASERERGAIEFYGPSKLVESLSRRDPREFPWQHLMAGGKAAAV